MSNKIKCAVSGSLIITWFVTSLLLARWHTTLTSPFTRLVDLRLESSTIGFKIDKERSEPAFGLSAALKKHLVVVVIRNPKRVNIESEKNWSEVSVCCGSSQRISDELEPADERKTSENMDGLCQPELQVVPLYTRNLETSGVLEISVDAFVDKLELSASNRSKTISPDQLQTRLRCDSLTRLLFFPKQGTHKRRNVENQLFNASWGLNTVVELWFRNADADMKSTWVPIRERNTTSDSDLRLTKLSGRLQSNSVIVGYNSNVWGLAGFLARILNLPSICECRSGETVELKGDKVYLKRLDYKSNGELRVKATGPFSVDNPTCRPPMDFFVVFVALLSFPMILVQLLSIGQRLGKYRKSECSEKEKIKTANSNNAKAVNKEDEHGAPERKDLSEAASDHDSLDNNNSISRRKR